MMRFLADGLRERLRGRVTPPQPDPSPPSDESLLHCRIAYNDYGGYCVPTSVVHRPAAEAILNGSVYEPATIDFIRAHCGSGDVVHAGAFFGDFLPALSRGLADGATLWAFEPNPESFRASRITVELNALENVRLFDKGLGRRSGSARVQTHDEDGRALGGLSRIVDNAAGSVPVGVVALDEVVPSDANVSVVHLDVEEFETHALHGALTIIRRCRPVLVIESVPDDDWLAAYLSPIGYGISGRVDTNTALAV